MEKLFYNLFKSRGLNKSLRKAYLARYKVFKLDENFASIQKGHNVEIDEPLIKLLESLIKRGDEKTKEINANILVAQVVGILEEKPFYKVDLPITGLDKIKAKISNKCRLIHHED